MHVPKSDGGISSPRSEVCSVGRVGNVEYRLGMSRQSVRAARDRTHLEESKGLIREFEGLFGGDVLFVLFQKVR